ncbi:MAG TPA: hypothetical protein VMT37_15460 [Solirubrobacterales bacterium]|nr:hypothetical protein [Solirubrobacterales bacterium]
MPFAENFDVAFDGLIRPALEEVGYEVRRADSVIDQRNVLSDIVLGIDGAELIVADLTGQNPNVFYELGIAHGLGVPTVMIAQALKEVPFDLTSYRVKEYSMRFDEAEGLQEFLREVGEQAAAGGVKFSSPVADFLRDGAASERLRKVAEGGEPSRGPQRNTPSNGDRDDREERDDEGEPGALDLLHSYLGSAERAQTGLDRITVAGVEIGTKIEGHSAAFDALGKSDGAGKVAKAHRISAQVAEDMNEYANTLKEELPDYEDAAEEMLQSGIGWLDRTGAEQDPAEVHGFRISLARLYLATSGAKAAQVQYREEIIAAKGLTSQLDRAVDRVYSLIGRIITTIEKTESFASRGADIAQEVLGEGPLWVVAESPLECFADARGEHRQGFAAIVLAIFDRGVSERMLPHTDEPLQRGTVVGNELDEKEIFPRTWVRDAATGAMREAWESSPRFAGKVLDAVEAQGDDDEVAGDSV